MAWEIIPDVDDGESFGGSATNAYRDGIMELQGALNAVRRRDARGTETYATGGTRTLIPDSTTESVGGITTVGGVLTVPYSNVYSLSMVLNLSAAPGTDDSVQAEVTRAGSVFFLNRQPLHNTTFGAIISWTTWMFAGDTVEFQILPVTADIDMSWETCVAMINHVLP